MILMIILVKKLEIILKKYYENLDNNGEIKIIYKQNFNTGRYYSHKFSLQNMFNEV